MPGQPPTQAASITFPRDGATITSLPVTVTGICPTGLLVKIFKNNVFSGSAQCVNGSFSIQIDLFGGTNELVAKVYDALDQEGPPSNVVRVTYPLGQFSSISRPSLTSTFAKKGANPNEELVWPITLSGGRGPYAISVDWGDGTTPDIISQQFPGTFNIKHIYTTTGVYNIIIRATDANGDLAFLQVVGVANGPLSQDNGNNNGSNDGQGNTVTKTKFEFKTIWLPLLLTIPLIITSFWLGKRYELHVLRKRLEHRDDI